MWWLRSAVVARWQRIFTLCYSRAVCIRSIQNYSSRIHLKNEPQYTEFNDVSFFDALKGLLSLCWEGNMEMHFLCPPPAWAAMTKTKLTRPSGPTTSSQPHTPAMKTVAMGIHLRKIPAPGKGSVSAPSMITRARNRMSSPSKQVRLPDTGFLTLSRRRWRSKIPNSVLAFILTLPWKIAVISQ